MNVSDIVSLYVDIIRLAVPYVFVFWACDFVTCTVLRAVLGGRLTFGSFK